VQALLWINTLVAIAGTVLNARMRREGFYLWLVANVVFLVHNLRIREYPQAALWAVYVGLAVYGLWSWGRKQREG